MSTTNATMIFVRFSHCVLRILNGSHIVTQWRKMAVLSRGSATAATKRQRSAILPRSCRAGCLLPI